MIASRVLPFEALSIIAARLRDVGLEAKIDPPRVVLKANKQQLSALVKGGNLPPAILEVFDE